MINEKQIAEVAEELTKGKRCYIHNSSNEIICLLNKSDDELGEEDAKLNAHVQASLEDYKEVLPPSSTLVFKMMDAFTASIEDFEKQSELMQALSFEQPFANFRTKVFRLKMEQEWNDFRLPKFIEVVKKQL
ncbi:MAG: hypothetical protein KJP21_06730 [Bacteroidia bacterium]|nr:hypothetical protein [Bacteroidia bacterium]NNJ56759.1 hypothetical protein [Bacteroidia bacterium]